MSFHRERSAGGVRTEAARTDPCGASVVNRRVRWFAVVMAAVLTASAADFQIVGTDLLGVGASQALYRFSAQAGLSLTLAFDGSRPGLGQLQAGRADVAVLILAPNETGTVAGFESVTLAYYCVAVIVPATVPLEHITVGQLRDVFGESGSKNLSRWGDLGVKGDLATSAIGTEVPAVGQGIAVDFFRQTVLQDRPFKSTVGRYATPAELALRLTGERRVLALAAGRGSNAPGGKVVRVAVRAGEPAFSPTPENLHSGDYPLALPLRVVFRRERARALRPVLRFLFSEEFAPVLEQAQIVPLAPAARQQQLAALEKA